MLLRINVFASTFATYVPIVQVATDGDQSLEIPISFCIVLIQSVVLPHRKPEVQSRQRSEFKSLFTTGKSRDDKLARKSHLNGPAN